MNAPTTETIATDSELVWKPRPARQVIPEDLEPGVVILGDDEGHTTIDEADFDGYFSEFGVRMLEDPEEPVTVVADDDIMRTDMRTWTAAKIFDYANSDVWSTNDDWHFQLNQLFLFNVVTCIEDWDNIVTKALETPKGKEAARTLKRPLDRVRIAVQNGLDRHTRKNAELGIDRVLYRSCLNTNR